MQQTASRPADGGSDESALGSESSDSDSDSSVGGGGPHLTLLDGFFPTLGGSLRFHMQVCNRCYLQENKFFLLLLNNFSYAVGFASNLQKSDMDVLEYLNIGKEIADSKL